MDLSQASESNQIVEITAEIKHKRFQQSAHLQRASPHTFYYGAFQHMGKISSRVFLWSFLESEAHQKIPKNFCRAF
jgi:hypothetical protein